MPIKLRNPFGKTQKKRGKVKNHKKPLLSSGERKQLSFYKKLRSEEKKAADVHLGNSLKGSFEKYLATQKKRSSSKKKKGKSKKKKKTGSKKTGSKK